MNKKNYLYILLLLGIILIAFVARFNGLDRPYWFDEANTIFYVNHSFDKMIEFVENDFSPPLYYVILYFWIRLFNDSELVTHMLSLIFGVLSVVAIYFAGKDIFNKKVGLWSALLLAVTPLAIFHSQEARMYSLTILFGVCLFWFFSKLLTGRKVYWILYIITSILALYTHYFFIFLILAQNIFAVFYYLHTKKRSFIFKWLLANLFILIVYLPWLFIFLQRVITITLLNTDKYWTFLSSGTFFIQEFLLSAFLPTNTSSIPALLGGIILVIFFVSSFISLNKAQEKNRLQISFDISPELMSLIFSSFFVFISCLLIKIFIPRYIVFLIPALILVIAFGLSRINQKYVNYLFLLAGIFLFLNHLILPAPYYPAYFYQWNKVAEYITENETNSADELVYVFSPQHYVSFMRYYNSKRVVGDSLPDYLVVDDVNLTRTKYIGRRIVNSENLSSITQKFNGYNQIWVINHPADDYKITDPEYLLTDWLESNFLLVERKYFPPLEKSPLNLTISKYQRAQ